MNNIELLAPAGNLDKLKMAIIYGADAVYLGGPSFGLRAGAGNFNFEQMKEGIDFAHSRGAKVYVTVNIIAHNRDLIGLEEYLRKIEEVGADAIIVADPGIFAIAKEVVPQMPIHISTQANNTNWAGAKFWYEQGAERVVMARELSLEEIGEIKAKVPVELEAFVHGAMCISYSGRCLLSNYMANRSANLGECAHPCRWKYYLVEETRPGEYYPIEEDERGTYIYNSKDLCMIDHIPELIKAGITSFKIEGRMKSVYYVATIVNAYRRALDKYQANQENYQIDEQWKQEMGKVSHRDYTTGFYFNKPTHEDQSYASSAYLRSYDFVGLVKEYDEVNNLVVLEQRNKILQGDLLEYAGPAGDIFEAEIIEMYDDKGNPITEAPHPQQVIKYKLDRMVVPFTMVRRKVKNES
jgi:U32 family peptidase